MGEDSTGKAGDEGEQPGGAPSPATRAFIARRAAMDEAAAAADAAGAAERDRLQAERHANYYNPVALLFGLVMVALLLFGFNFIVERLRTDPWFSDCPTGQGGCR
jgi:hypothetical protein